MMLRGRFCTSFVLFKDVFCSVPGITNGSYHGSMPVLRYMRSFLLALGFLAVCISRLQSTTPHMILPAHVFHRFVTTIACRPYSRRTHLPLERYEKHLLSETYKQMQTSVIQMDQLFMGTTPYIPTRLLDSQAFAALTRNPYVYI